MVKIVSSKFNFKKRVEKKYYFLFAKKLSLRKSINNLALVVYFSK